MRKFIGLFLALFCWFAFQTAASSQTLVDMVGSNNSGTKNSLNGIPVDVVTSGKSTYSATVAYFTPYATPTDIVTIAGSATKTIKVQRILMSGTQTTAGVNQWFLIKRAAADTSGTSTAQTSIPLDANNAAATASVLLYTAAPTINSTIGTVRAPSVLANAPAGAGVVAEVPIWDASYTGQPVVLRGAAQQLALNFAAAAVPTGLSISVTIIWTEE